MAELDFSLGSRKTLFVEVILPLAIAKPYTYRVPREFNEAVTAGMRVIVQFGKNKIYSAVIQTVHTEAPLKYEAKYILDLVDTKPLVNDKQLQLWQWIADYYMSTLGDVLQAALPAAFKMASETKIVAADDVNLDRSTLSDKGFLVLQALDLAGELTIGDVIKILGQKTVFPLLKSLYEQGFIHISEEIKQRYKPKTKIFLRLAEPFMVGEGQRVLLDSLNRAPKQQDAVLTYLQISKQRDHISRQELIEMSGCGTSAVSALIEKRVLSTYEKVVSRIDGADIIMAADFHLSTTQEETLEAIGLCFQEKAVTLLHGVTASGKTQIYIRLIEQALERGQSALYLLPEIALTTQITHRLKLHFGDKLGVYHSRFNDNERAEVWQKVQKGAYQVVIGARSSVFLPFENLGLIIVDEEHETSYKQYDPAPRYHARDTAIYLGMQHNAKVLLGSATPSVESYYNAKAGKYGLVSLAERYGEAKQPQITVVDISKAKKQNQMKSYFSDIMLEAIAETVASRQQVILFQNRRGHTPFLQCGTCGFVAKCVNCDVSLTYHKSSDLLHCHYCGFSEPQHQTCPACGTAHLQSKGFGTERVVEELEVLLPDLRIGRLDFDSTKGKHGFDRVISAFDNHQYDVLVGTQMITKGLDFGNVSLIGIVNADGIINFPDFRAYERAFSLFSQVAGRAGRRRTEGRVIIQTQVPHHRILEQVMKHDYQEMFSIEAQERKNFNYPPFYRLIRLDIKHSNQSWVHDAAQRFAGLLRQSLGARVLGPEPPLISRVRNYFIQTITLKIERKETSIVKVKELIRQAIVHFELDKKNRGVRIQIDVDPY
ncbi:MAG: replication restart helicase PriA [Sphingobacterium sp.]